MKKVLRGDHHCRRDHHLIRSSAELFISWRGTEFSARLSWTAKKRRQTNREGRQKLLLMSLELSLEWSSLGPVVRLKKNCLPLPEKKQGELKCTSDHQMQPASQ